MWTESGIDELCNAVIVQACRDWREAMRTLIKHPRDSIAESTKDECDLFFLSGDFEMFTDIDGKWLLDELQKEIRETKGKTKMEKMKEEAVKRMKELDIFSKAIEEFANKGVLNVSEDNGILYWLDDEQQARVSEFESEHECLVYHVIHSYTQFGELLSYLYVSSDEEEWEMDREDIKDFTPMAYVDNLTYKDLSEFGCIGVHPIYGGLVRTQ